MEPVAAVSDTRLNQLLPAARAAKNSKVSEEFLTIFYKEMLKEAIKTPNLSVDNDKDKENNVFSTINRDVMIEEFAKQLAKNQIAQAGGQGWLPAAAVK